MALAWLLGPFTLAAVCAAIDLRIISPNGPKTVILSENGPFGAKTVNFEQFLAAEGRRLENYIQRFAWSFGLSGSILHDLRQEAHLAAFRALPYWRAATSLDPAIWADEGATQATDRDLRKSVFNWCAGPMRRAMERTVKREFGQRPYGKAAIRDFRRAFDDTRMAAPIGPPIEDAIDLRRALAADRKPKQLLRFVAAALSPMAGAELAKAEGISRQAVNLSARRAKARLRVALA